MTNWPLAKCAGRGRTAAQEFCYKWGDCRGDKHKEVSKILDKEISKRLDKEISKRIDKEISKRIDKEIAKRLDKEISKRFLRD